MSLTTVPKVNFATDDGVTTDDLNEIGANLNSLEDSKIEDGDSLTALTIGTATITTETVTTGNITTVNSTTVNNSGFITSNYKSSDESEGINSSFNTDGFDYVFKDGLLVSRTAE